MPSSKSTRKSSTRKQSAPVTEVETAATVATSAAGTATATFPTTVPDTAATRALWAALTAQPDATAVELADAAGVGRSTATRTLALLEETGAATRTAGGREGARRLPDRWRSVIADVEPAAPPTAQADDAEKHDDARDDDDAEPEVVREDQPSAAADAPAATPNGGTAARLGSGQLRDMVLGHLREHPDEDFTPSAMGKVLARSAGAIFNACQRLTADATIVQTSEKPRRYRIATGS